MTAREKTPTPAELWERAGYLRAAADAAYAVAYAAADAANAVDVSAATAAYAAYAYAPASAAAYAASAAAYAASSAYVAAHAAADRMAFPQEYGRTPMGPPRPSYNDDRLDKILVQGMNTGASRARVLHDMLADVVPLSRETNISVPDIRDYLRRRGVV